MKKLTIIVQLMLCVLPVSLLLGVHFLADQLWLCAAFAGLYVALAALCVHIRGGRKRLLIGLLCTAVLAAAGVFLLPWRTEWPSAGLALMYVILLLATLPIGGWPKDQELSVNIGFAGLAGYILLQLLLLTALKGFYAAIAPAVTMGFITYLVLWMLMLNRISLQNAASKSGRAPASIQRRNTLMTLVFAAVILFIAAIPALAEWLGKAWNLFREILLAIGRWLASLLPQQQSAGGSPGGGGDLFSDFGEAAEPSLFAQIMEKIAIVLAVAAIGVLAIWTGRFLWRRLRILMKKLWALIGRYTLAASEDYVDEISDTREDGGESRQSRRRALRRRLRQVNEADLSPAQRIRYRYQLLLWKRSEWTRSSTARENLPAAAASLYEKARYSTSAVTPEEAQRFASESREAENRKKRG